jgi:cell division septation protein DedD
MADEGFHEIQLNAKQLICLFMTGAVVLVVTFLCGVLVGRGVRAQKEPVVSAETLTQGAPAAADPTASAVALQPAAKVAPQAPPPTAPPQPEEDLSYYSRLEGQAAPPDAVKPVKAAKGAEARPVPAAPKAKPGTEAKPKPKDVPPAPTAPGASPKAEPAADSEPAGTGYSLKIAAYRDKAQADTLASRLSGKGYGTFVVALPGKGPTLYSVRVGKFKTRKDADTARRRLEKEEQFKPLITR